MTNEDILQLMKREIAPAIGCTEPVAVALAAARAREALGCMAERAKIAVSRNIFKNAMGVGIPGTALTGLNMATALGLLGGNSAYGLEVLRDAVDAMTVASAQRFVDSGAIQVSIAQNLPSNEPVPKLFISVTVYGGGHTAQCVVRDNHRNIVYVSRDEQMLYRGAYSCVVEGSPDSDPLTLAEIWRFVREVPITQLGFLSDGLNMNLRVAKEGLAGEWGVSVGRTLLNGRELDELSLGEYAAALTSAAADARMSGCTLPVMSTTGSGNQGLTASLPVWASARKLGASEEDMLRAEAFSQLVTIHIKANIGKLSALCGCAIAASIGSACGMTYLMGGSLQAVRSAVQNMIADISGLICDGAKPGCALKIATSVTSAVQCALLAVSGACVTQQDGIIARDVEDTIHNLRTLSNQGMQETDTVILDIMLGK